VTVGAITHPSALEHNPGRSHPERRERVQSILDHLDECGLAARLQWTSPEPAPRQLVELVHDQQYVEFLHRVDATGGEQLDADTRLAPGSLDATLRGSQAAVDACAKVLSGEWDGAFSVMRPPGHHATPDRAMGFCMTNHAAVAARWAVREGGARRAMILDWDAHHGNGTQDIFWTDPSVLYVSLHQYPFYPGTGAITDVGGGPGEGTTLNVPVPAGTGEDAYERAMRDVILPVASAFEPDVVIVSAGYDAHRRDPLCMLRLTAGAYYRFTRMLAEFRGPVCVLEGGYDLDALAWGAAATVSAMLDDDAPAGVPADEIDASMGDPEAHRWVDRVSQQWLSRTPGKG
jgi:acetoin utilization deacetylase AcuC-like enzyme